MDHWIIASIDESISNEQMNKEKSQSGEKIPEFDFIKCFRLKPNHYWSIGRISCRFTKSWVKNEIRKRGQILTSQSSLSETIVHRSNADRPCPARGRRWHRRVRRHGRVPPFSHYTKKSTSITTNEDKHWNFAGLDVDFFPRETISAWRYLKTILKTNRYPQEFWPNKTVKAPVDQPMKIYRGKRLLLFRATTIPIVQ